MHHNHSHRFSHHYRSILRSCARAASEDVGEKIHAFLLKKGIAGQGQGHGFIYNALLQMYAACASVSSARQAFEHIPQTHRDVVDWTTLILCYARNGLPGEAMRLFLAMEREGVLPDHVTMIALFGAASQLSDVAAGVRAHLCIVKRGLPFPVTARNAAIDMYVKCGRMGDARRMFDEILSPTVVSWTVILTGTIKWEGVDIGRRMFDRMREKNVVSWTVMIAGYVESGFPTEASSLIAQMLHENHGELNHVTLCSLLSASSQSGDLTMGRWIHLYAVKITKEKEKHPMVGTALVDMYAKCARIGTARQVFEKMPHRNVVSWNAMLSGLAMHGHGKEVLHLFSRMIMEQLQPDDITFVAVLSACSHSGLVDQGCQYFHDLWPIYHITPKMEHFACMVDILGRAGRLEEAMVLVREMPIRANEVVLGSLLASCSRHHGMLGLGKHLFLDLIQIDPLNTQYHILLSNMYASAGRREEANALRLVLKKRGIRRAPGLSFIHVNGQIHQFTAGDKSHPQIQEVYTMLDEVVRRLRLAGYVPNTASCISCRLDTDINDDSVDEQEKEQALFYHSERLAISFGLISTRPGTPLCIFKNLRICQDCHSAIKLMSDVFKREIVVRDRNRFHCFKLGSCSCSDYW